MTDSFHMANGRGGRREGAGRPRGRKELKTLANEEARELVRSMVTEGLTRLVEAQMDIRHEADPCSPERHGIVARRLYLW